MAKITFPGLNDYELMISRLSKGVDDIAGKTIYAGAGIVADAIKENIKALLETGAFQTVACLQGRQRPGQLGALFRVEAQGQGEVLLVKWEP